jgi:hypothetical protein
LTCRYCGYQASLARSLAEGADVFEEDFIQALATAKGHLHPQSMAVFECPACGAGYLLEPKMLSITCAHCGASYAIDTPQQVELIPPQGIVPFSISQGEAGRKLRDWLTDQGLAAVERLGEVRGLYLPVWTFDISGEAPYHFQRYNGNEWVDETGSQLLLFNDLPVVASHHLAKQFADNIHSFDLSQLEPYEQSQIAGWPAETYSIPPREAAMAARWYVVEQTKQKVRQTVFGRTRSLELRSPDLLISAYRLALLPFWLSSYVYQGTTYQAAINGQTGAVQAEKPDRGLGGWLRRLLG